MIPGLNVGDLLSPQARRVLGMPARRPDALGIAPGRPKKDRSKAKAAKKSRKANRR